MKSFLHRLLFIILILPIGSFLIGETIISLIYQILKWIFIGEFNDEFILNSGAMRIIEFFQFDKLLE